MRKKIISIILLVAMVLTMAAGCGKKEDKKDYFVFYVNNELTKVVAKKITLQHTSSGKAQVKELLKDLQTQPEDAKWRLDNMHETYLKDMKSKYVYPNVFMSIDDTNKVSQYDTDIKKYAEQKKADWILNGGIDKEWDSYLKKMEKYGLSAYLAIKQKYFDQYQESLKEEK